MAITVAHAVDYEPDDRYDHLVRPSCSCGWSISGYVTRRTAKHFVGRHVAASADRAAEMDL